MGAAWYSPSTPSSTLSTTRPPATPATSPARVRMCERYYKVTERKQISGGGLYTINILGDEIFASVATSVWSLVFLGKEMLHFGVIAEGKWICGTSPTPYKWCLSHVVPDKEGKAQLRVEFSNNLDIIKETIQRCSTQASGEFVEGPRVQIDPSDTPFSNYNKVADIVFDASKFKIQRIKYERKSELVTSCVAPDHVKTYNFVNCKRYFQTVASVFQLVFPPDLAAKLEERGFKLDDKIKEETAREKKSEQSR